VNKNPIPLIRNALKKADFLAGKHGARNCIYDEGRKCISVGKGDHLEISQQMLRYLADGYPKNNGLINSTVLIRRTTPAVIELENDWWNEIKNGCVRDQVSFNYVAWKNNFEYRCFNWKSIVDRGVHKRK
jgi:hypothetical protein